MPVVTNPTIGANFNTKLINDLPTGRTPFTIAELAPGLTDNGPNAGQLTIGGAFAYDNVFLINGVDVNDNIFGTNNNLFIEDAIEETQVLTSGISAEYGRFSGGVVNIVTKRGGDIFSGSYRHNLSNASWTDETPFETRERPNRYSNALEGTFGGPILRARAWFFSAGRYENSTEGRDLRADRHPLRLRPRQQALRAEGHADAAREPHGAGRLHRQHDRPEEPARPDRLDRAAHAGHALAAATICSWPTGTACCARSSSRRRRCSQKRLGLPQHRRHQHRHPRLAVPHPRPDGIPANQHYNAPFFDSNDPEDRNNRQVAGSLSTLLSSGKARQPRPQGRLRVVPLDQHRRQLADVDRLRVLLGLRPQRRRAGVRRPGPADSDASSPDTSRLYNWLATRGARIDIKTASLYAHDRWAVNRRLTVDAGVRFERVRSEATGDIIGADTDTIVPRLAATFDAKGDGRWILQGTYAHYAGKYSEAQFTSNTDVANPSLIRYTYTGPAGEGMDFAPGLRSGQLHARHRRQLPDRQRQLRRRSALAGDARVHRLGRQPDLAARLRQGDLRQPRREGLHRRLHHDSTTAPPTSSATASFFGTFDNIVYRNTDEPHAALPGPADAGQLSRRAATCRSAGHWTVQLQNEGDFEGEAANQPGNPSLFGDNPEVFTADRNYPIGRFDDFQRHKVRVWGVWNRPIGRFGALDVSAMWKYNSALTYTLFAANYPLSAQQEALAEAAGYANEPGGGAQNLFFGERGSQSFAGYGLVDLGVNYSIPVWRTVRPYLKVEAAERLQQPEADRLGHGGQRRSERPASIRSACRWTTPRRALRPGDAQPGLPDLPSRLRRRSHGPDGVRPAVLSDR